MFDITKAFKDVCPFPGEWEPIPGKRHELSQAYEVIDRLKDYAEEVKEYTRNCPGLKVSSDFDLAEPKVVEKNIAWLTSVSILRLQPMKFTIDGDDPETYRELSGKLASIQNSLGRFAEAINSNILIPVPSVIEEYDGIWNASTSVDLSKDILEVGFSNGYAAQQFSEHLCVGMPVGVIEFLLPRVARVPFGEILALREEYASLFARFQQELVAFIRTSERADSEGKLVDLLLHIDEETRKLQGEMAKIDRRRRLENLGLVYSFGVLSLLLVLPSEVFQSLAALFGTTTILKSLSNIRLLELEKRELKDDPFYIPYRLTELARQMK